jgi:translation initiation factor 3 subunit C
LIQKAHDCLQNISAGKPRELLAQGQVRWADKDPEQERVERRRLIPYHMHINLDLLDTCYLTCAMLLELPYMARGMTAPNPTNQSVVSRQFRKYMQNYNRQIFTGPPENTREHVMAAAKCMVSGEWQKGSKYILGLEVWNLIPNNGGGRVKEMLGLKLKEEAVRTYLLSSGVAAYSSVSLEHICESFDMQAEPARRIISKMIFNKEITAAWDTNSTLVLQKADPSTTQSLAVKLAEKVAALVDTNERLLDSINGGNMYASDWGAQTYRGKQQNDGSKRYQKSGAVGRDYQGKRDYNNRDGNRGRGGGRGKGNYNNDRRQSHNNSGNRYMRSDGEQGNNSRPTAKPTAKPNAWGGSSAAGTDAAPAPAPNAWGVK